MDSETASSSSASSVVGYCLFAADGSTNSAHRPRSGSVTMMDGMSVWSPMDTSSDHHHGDRDAGCDYNENKVTVSFCTNAITADAVEQLTVKESDCQMQLMTKPSEVAVVVE